MKTDEPFPKEPYDDLLPMAKTVVAYYEALIAERAPELLAQALTIQFQSTMMLMSQKHQEDKGK